MPESDLATLLETVVPRERAGSQTAARYDFQANFGILKLVELRESGKDFRVVFDIFDDIMVLDPAEALTQVSFYQVKSKDPGEWNTTDLCRKIGANKPRSIVSRLYSHVASFGLAVTETGMVTNAPIAVPDFADAHPGYLLQLLIARAARQPVRARDQRSRISRSVTEFVARMNQRVRPEVAGPMTGSVKSGSDRQA
jgi:hypothetical protein